MDARFNAANAILERGVRFRMPALFLKRLLKRDWVTIHHLKAGTILEFSRVVIEHDLENAILLGDYEFLMKSVEPCARCIAIAILNDKQKIERKADKLTKQLLWKISAESLIDIFVKISLLNRASDFTRITKFFSIQMMMMMNAKNLGQTADGS